jgi:hypothetical protein
VLAPLLALTMAGATAAAAEPRADRSRPADVPPMRLGLVVSADVGGGGAAGVYSYYTPSGVFEGEVTAGYELGGGVRPELSVLLGMYPRAYGGFRLGGHYDWPTLPVYGRAAIDVANPRSGLQFRWLLLGGGYAMWLTDALGVFAEADLGVPFKSGIGVPLLLRAGASFRF